jgi:hypothetical protein
MKRLTLVLFSMLLAACASAPRTASAPWSGTKLPASSVPPVYLAEWKVAENRATCAPLAFASLGEQSSATPRRANFSGGWAVAYDLPNQRSAFGIAGAGVDIEGERYDQWPHNVAWSDGSSAGYGPEGGSGPKQLAYLEVAGQRCLYNVWSHLGVEHLEFLLDQLRFIDAGR